MASLTDAEKAALLWPIKAKGAVNRFNPLGDPAIEKFYHNSMEQGRFLESSIADANNWLLQKKTLLNEYVISYTHMNQLAVDGQLGHAPRIPKFVADSISILQTAQRLQQELVSLVEAIQQNITKLLAIEASMLQMVTTASDSLANLLNNVCNWGIPGLPSIPNLFPDQIWNWNGFLFSPVALFAALRSNTNFNFNFTFSQCHFGPTGSDELFVTNPLSTQTYSGLVYGSANYDPPLGGVATPASQDLNDPAFIAQMQGTISNPVFNPSFNPNENMLGAVPDPHTIISNYQMPAATYVADIVSICPVLRSNTVEPTDADYLSPNLAGRAPQLRKDLVHFVNLSEIVATNYDPFVVSAWLLYLNLARQNRGGVWIPNFEVVYNQYIQPSVGGLLTQTVPWNDLIGQTNVLWMGTWTSVTAYAVNDVVVFNGVNYIALLASTGVTPGTDPLTWGSVPDGTVYSDAPVIPLIATFQSLPQDQLLHLFWQLSYIEASILGYTRNNKWDTNQDTSYLAGPTGSDLDYKPTAVTAPFSSLVLGSGTAEFPVPVTFPTVMTSSLNQVVALASTNIQNDPNYLSPRLGNRFTYNQFAQATMVDRFSQFWRDFSTNLSNFLAQDPYIVQFAITYPEILDGALDPLASSASTTAYASLLADVATRNRSWIPGTPLLNIPVAPIVNFSNNSVPDVNTNGWIDPADFSPVAFLARPDIQALPIPVQIAMLRTNLSYAGLNKWKNNFQASIATNLANANALLQATQQIGFEVSVFPNPILSTSITSNLLTVVADNVYQPGDTVLLQNTAESFLNDQVVTVAASPAPSATQFSAAFTHANYSNPADTGSAGLATLIPIGTTGAPVAFDTTGFDFTGNVTSQTTFTIQSTGTYSGVGSINWLVDGAGTVMVTVTQNGVAVASASGTSTVASSLTVSLSLSGQFAMGDVVQVIATHNFSTPQIVDGGSSFSMVQSQVTPPPSASVAANSSETQSYTTDAVLSSLTAVRVQADGNISAVNPVIAPITATSITSNVLTVTVANTFLPGAFVVLSATAEGFLNGQVVQVITASLTQFTATFTHANYSNPADTGTAEQVVNATSPTVFVSPIPDGITLTSAILGGVASVGQLYGGLYSVSGAALTPGLLYVGPGGVLTQNFASLPTSAFWVVVVGRAISATEFIFEPHLPMRAPATIV